MRLTLRGALPLLAAAAGLAMAAPARADGSIFTALNPHCPKCQHCSEGVPHIKFKHGCPKPCCDPCSLQHFGYYQTCWTPWPFPPDWSHCRVPPTSSMVPPHPGKMPVPDQVRDPRNRLPDVEQPPTPRLLDNNNTSMAPNYYRYAR